MADLTSGQAVFAAGATQVETKTASDARTALGLGTAAVLDTGTTANKVVKLDGSALLPAVDGSALTNLPTLTAAQLAAITHAATSKVTPADNDEIPVADSAASYALKKFVWSNIKALFALLAHGHSGTTDGSKLAQANTHESPDTDTGTSSLHHTLGTGANQSAAGNDTRITGALQKSTATTKGDLFAATASATIARLGVGSDGQVLTADAASAAGVKWAAAGGGGGGGSIVNTTTTASTTIPSPGATVVVHTTAQLAAWTKGQNTLVTDGTYLIHGIITDLGTLTATVRALNNTGDTAASGTIASGAVLSVDCGMTNVLWHYEFSDNPSTLITPTLDGTVPGDLEIVFAVQNYVDDYLYWQVNGDSTSGHYHMQEVYASGSTGVGGQHQADTQFSYVPLSSSYPAMMRALMPNYTSADPKPVEYVGGNWNGTRTHFGDYMGGAITSITFYPGSYHFVSGSITIRRKRYG